MAETRPGASSRVLDLIRRYPLVDAVLAAGLAAGVATVVGAGTAASWIATIAAGGVAVIEAVRMIRDLRSGRWGLDVLAIIAIGGTLATGDPWAALIVALMVTGGQALDDYASARARTRLTALLAAAPRIALRRTAVGDLESVPLDDIEPGDVVSVTPGGTVPVDGVLLSDEAELDESRLTGESLPVSHAAGSALVSGSINGSTAIELRATARAADSQYQQIVKLVDGAASSRGAFVRMADRLSIPFTVLALAIAGIAWFVSGDPHRFAQVLVVATPCPLLIAAPVAFVAGMGRAAKEGVVIKTSESLERLARPRTVALDKTGTLTAGRPRLARVDAFGSHDKNEVLAVAAGAELHSNHVLAAAIVEAARERGIEPTNVTEAEEVTASGVTGHVDGIEVCVGKAVFVASQMTAFDAPPLAAGETAVYVGIGGEPAGRIVLRDEVRGDAAATIGRLRALGVGEIVMLTGDAGATARHVAEEVGIADIRADLLPGDKVRAVANMSGHPILMVGDGVNDAPVLAAADVGIAMGARGSTAASETADVVILTDDISRVVTAISTSRRTVGIARQSVAVGIGLSVVLMLVAATGVIPAIAGALLQEVVDVVTILNGLRAGRGGRAEGTKDPTPQEATSARLTA